MKFLVGFVLANNGHMRPISIQTAFVTLASEQLQDLVMFYQGLLGQEPRMYSPERYAEFMLPGLRLALFKPSGGSEFAGTAGRMSLCIEVEDLGGAIAALEQLGYPPPEGIMYASHGQEIYAYDPDGNRLIFHQAA